MRQTSCDKSGNICIVRRRNLLFTFGMEIYTTHTALLLVKADVVEAFEASAVDSAHTMVGDEEVFLPAHEDVLALSQVRDHDKSLAYLFRVRPERRELAPMVHVDLFRCAPILVFCYKAILAADELALEIRRQGRVVFGKAYMSTQVSGYSDFRKIGDAVQQHNKTTRDEMN